MCHGGAEEDRLEIRRETDEQDANLSRIGDTVAVLHTMGKELQEELTGQGPLIGRLQVGWRWWVHPMVWDVSRGGNRLPCAAGLRPAM